MSADQETHFLLASDLTEAILGAFFSLYNELGAGFAEGVYESALAVEMEIRRISFTRQPELQVAYRGQIGEFRPDFIAGARVIVETKAVSTLAPSHEAQLVNYLKASGIQVGLLLNFGVRAEFRRRVLTKALSA
jgi:GxxExxY protein